MALKILQDWGEVIAVEKPAGWLSIPGRGNKEGIPVVSQELGKLLRGGDLSVPNKNDLFIVHRLDQGTSGVMIFAKSEKSHRALSDMFSEGKVTKTYWALVKGEFSESPIIIDVPIFKLPSKKNKSVVDPKGKPSITKVRRILTAQGFSLIEALPLTGRSHQIRVHLAHIGFPLVGDRLYGGPQEILQRQFMAPLLHSKSIAFSWASKELEAMAPINGDFLDACLSLGFHV